MKQVFYTTALALLSTLNLSYGQFLPSIEWVRNYSERNSINNVPTAIDANQNVYITGYTFDGSVPSFTTLKYDEFGNLMWNNSYNYTSSGNDRSYAVKVDLSGNTFVAGESQNANGLQDVALIKYDTQGNEDWVYRFDNGFNDIPHNLYIDNSSNCFVVGTSENSNGSDGLIVKTDNSGNQEWVLQYNNGTNQENEIVSFAFGNNNTAYALNKNTINNETTFEVIKINIINGTVIATYSHNNAGDNYTPKKIIYDNAIYIIGSVESNNQDNSFFCSINDNTSLSLNWISTYNPYFSNARGSDIATNSSGDLYTLSLVENNGVFEYHTKSINTQNGNTIWTNIESTQLSFINILPKFAIDSFDHIYVVGEIADNQGDALIYQVTPGGNTAWKTNHNGANSGIDAAVDIVPSINGTLYVAAQTQNSSARFDYTTLKINQTPAFFVTDINNEEPNNLFAYTENKGQLLKSNSTLADEVSYYANNPDMSVFIRENGFSFVKSTIDTATNIRDTVQRIDLDFLNHNVLTRPYHFETTDFKQNFYAPHCPNGITGVNQHNRIVYPDFYRNIDLQIYNSDYGIKYYFVIKPGGDPNEITHHFIGADSVGINNNELHIANYKKTIVFDQPKAYQINGINSILPINGVSWNEINGDFVFDVTSYNAALPLVIQVDRGEVNNPVLPKSDGNLMWSTYYGGQGITNFEDVDNDNFGNVVYGGTANEEDFPAPTGQTTILPYAGGRDAILVKLNDLIEPEWATYFGGADFNTGVSPNEFLTSIAVNENGNDIYIVGHTNSTDLPIIDGGGAFYSDDENQNVDAFIARFNGDGILQWSSYFGEEGDNRFLDIEISETTGNVYCVGSRAPDTPLLTISNGYNETQGSGSIVQFNSSNNLTWSTAWDALRINAVAVDDFERLYITGTTNPSTESQNMPVLNPDALQPTTHEKQDWRDAYLAAFREDGELLYSFFYGGKTNETGTDVVADKDGNVYVAGYTDDFFNSNTVANDLPSVSGTGLLLPSGDNRKHGFLFRVNNYVGDLNGSSGSQIAATSYFGSLGKDLNLKLAINENNILFATGQTSHKLLPDPSLGTDIDFPANQPSGFYTVTDRPASVTDVYFDAFVAAFNANFTLLWSTYVGGHFREEARAISFSPFNNRLYFAGFTNTNNATLDPGDTPLPNFEFDDQSTIDYWQVEPFESSDLPAWAAFFDVELLNDPTLQVVEQNSDEKELLVYPNPTAHALNIIAEETIENIQIMDLNGRLVYAEKCNSLTTTIPVEAFSSGVYVVQINTVSETHRRKIVKQ